MLFKEKRYELLEWHNYQKNVSKVKKHDQGNSNNNSKTKNKSMNRIISAAVDRGLSQLDGSDKKYDRYDNKNPVRSSSTNTDNTLCLKIILKKAK